MVKIIAVIPARGGSKNIPRKNVRFLDSKPLLTYAIETASKSKYIDRIVVSSEDDEILEYAKIYGTEIVKRPENLATDSMPLDPVIFHAVVTVESRLNTSYDFVVTLQPTVPLLSVQTLDKAIESMISGEYDSLISVVKKSHIYWRKRGAKVILVQEERRNRQYLEPLYQEVGAIFISRRDIITESNHIGEEKKLFEIPVDESIDIDSYKDWWQIEKLINQPNIGIRVDGDREIGLGHVYRMITIANRIFSDKVTFLMDRSKKLGIDKVQRYNYPILKIEDEKDLLRIITETRLDIIINDILDTNIEYISHLKDMGIFIVNFEDLGEGSDCANVVINALYEHSAPPDNHFYGPKFTCLRDEFRIYPSKSPRQQVRNILITFGGSDQNNLTLTTFKAIEKLKIKNVSVEVILGLGYKSKDTLLPYAKNLTIEGYDIIVRDDVKIMAKHISKADIVITSNGRTIYEVAAMKVPCISISQNEREARHLFAHFSKGVKNIGIAYNINEDEIASAILELIQNFELRKKMYEQLKKVNLLKGTDRVLKLISEKYEEWKREKNEKLEI